MHAKGRRIGLNSILIVVAHYGHSAHHSITLLARTKTVCGIVSPSALAGFMLITSSNFVGCCTGKSAGTAPF